MSATPKPRFHATGDANLVSGAFTLVIPELGASGADACTQVDMFMLTVMERAKGERVVVLLGDCCSNMRNKAMVQGIPATLVATGEFDAVFIIYLWQLHSKHLADANFGATYNEVRRRDIFIPEEWGAAAMRISVDDGGIITNDINADNSAFMLNSAAQTQWCRFFEQFFILGGGVATEDKSLAFKQSNYHIIGARSVAALDNIEDSELRGFVQRFASAPPGWLAMQTLPSPGSFVRVWNPFRGALKPWSKKTGNGPPKKKAKTDAAPNFTDFEQPLAKKVEVWDEAAAAAAAANAGAAASAAGATAVLPSHADYSPTQAAYGASARCAAAAKAAATSAWTLQQIVSLKAEEVRWLVAKARGFSDQTARNSGIEKWNKAKDGSQLEYKGKLAKEAMEALSTGHLPTKQMFSMFWDQERSQAPANAIAFGTAEYNGHRFDAHTKGHKSERQFEEYIGLKDHSARPFLSRSNALRPS